GLAVLLGLPVRVEQGVQRGRLLALGQAGERGPADVQDVETVRVRGGQQLPRLGPQRLERGHLRQRRGEPVERGRGTPAATPTSPHSAWDADTCGGAAVISSDGVRSLMPPPPPACGRRRTGRCPTGWRGRPTGTRAGSRGSPTPTRPRSGSP